MRMPSSIEQEGTCKIIEWTCKSEWKDMCMGNFVYWSEFKRWGYIPLENFGKKTCHCL